MKTNNSRRIILISLFALLFVGTLLLGARRTPALAEDFYPDHFYLVETNEPHLINDLATKIAEKPIVENESEDQESAMNASAYDVSASLQSKIKDFENDIISQSGWLHYVYHLESDIPNGVSLPKNYSCDGWYFIDESGNVTQHIVSYYDDAGNLNQREIYKNNTFINLTTNDKMETDGPYSLKLDYGVTKYMLEMQAEGAILTEEVSLKNEKPMTKFSITGNFDKPTVFGNASQPVESVRMKILFDQATGTISELAYVYIMADGTEALFYKVQTPTLEWGELPQEFTSLLEGK